MLRLLVLLLVLLNAGYFAWSNDMLRVYGYGPAHQGEPERLKQQIHPERLRIVSNDAARAADAPNAAQAQAADTNASCLQAGPLDEAQSEQLRQSAQGILPAGTWSINEVSVPTRWIIYMGKYPDAQALAKKRAELVALGLRVESLKDSALAPGLSLGGFPSQERASAEMAELAKRGVRTAHVVPDGAEVQANMLRITPVDDALRARLDQLRPHLAGKSLRPCS